MIENDIQIQDLPESPVITEMVAIGYDEGSLPDGLEPLLYGAGALAGVIIVGAVVGIVLSVVAEKKHAARREMLEQFRSSQHRSSPADMMRALGQVPRPKKKNKN